MRPQHYSYVGPPHVRDTARTVPPGTLIHSSVNLKNWLKDNIIDADTDGAITATFTVGVLRLASRRSEHVACASGGPVLSAGEITFSADGDVTYVTNQSTGFCPKPESWSSVAAALDSIPVAYPDDFTRRIVFRLCTKCNEINIVKDGWFVCDLCESDLSVDWNFPSAS